MNLKKIKLISPIIIFILCALTHFGYQIMPNIITSFFFPVNESIYEHMKMIYTSIIIYSLIELYVIKKNDIIVNNIYFNMFFSGIVNIFSFLIIYLPIRSIMGEKMIITFIILFISNIITSFISYNLLKTKKLVNSKLSIVLVILMFIALSYFTYKPLHNDLFYDSKEEKYGI